MNNITKKDLIKASKLANSLDNLIKNLGFKVHHKNRNKIKKLFNKYKVEIPNYRGVYNRTPLNLIIDIVNHSNNFTEVLSAFGKTDRGANIQSLRDFLNKKNIDYSHFNKKNIIGRGYSNIPYLFKKNSTIGRKSLKELIIKMNLIKYECDICGIPPVWKNKPLVLTLDHINGINNDNRLENLRFVCSNCDSQLETFGSKNINKVKDSPSILDVEIFKIKQLQKYNFGFIIVYFHNNYIPILKTKSILHNIYTKRKVSFIKNFKEEHGNDFYCEECGKPITRFSNSKVCKSCVGKMKGNIPSLEQLKEDLIELGSYVAVGNKYNVSDSAVRKWLKKYGNKDITSELLNFEEKIKTISIDFKNKVNILTRSYENYFSIKYIRAEYNKGTLSKEKEDIIKKYKLPLFETKSPKEILEERKKEYISFVKKHRRKPSTINKDEKKLLQWLSNTKKRYLNVYDEVIEEIEQYL